MKRELYVTLFLSFCLLGCATQQTVVREEVFSKAEFAPFLNRCSLEERRRNESECLREIERLLLRKKIWSPASESIERGNAVWASTPLKVDFQAKQGDEGDFQIVDYFGELVPRISLATESDPFELLITLNHELTHYAHSAELKKLYADDSKLEKCLGPFRKAILDNEREAYLAEIEFWNLAPEWFRGSMPAQFSSRILGLENVTYAVYYEKLAIEIRKDPNFIPHRYIQLGKFPRCASRWYSTNQN